jgi:hypothetical protein
MHVDATFRLMRACAAIGLMTYDGHAKWLLLDSRGVELTRAYHAFFASRCFLEVVIFQGTYQDFARFRRTCEHKTLESNKNPSGLSPPLICSTPSPVSMHSHGQGRTARWSSRWAWGRRQRQRCRPPCGSRASTRPASPSSPCWCRWNGHAALP